MKKRKKDNELKIYLGITFLICILLSLLGVSLNPSMFIWVFIGVLSVVLLLTFLSTPIMKGKIGELRIAIILKKITKKYNGKVINDVIIIDNDKSSQIDHVLFHKSGIYVIETKNYSGRIYGKYDQKEWTQVLMYGRVKNKLYNPIYQNNVHINRLMNVLDIKENIYSCIIFVKGNTKYITADNVYSPKMLKSFILERINEDNYSEEIINELYNKLNDYKINPRKTIKDHVKDIKIKRENINNNICPNCNIPLILRTSKNGNQFYGCSNYPKCKFTKNMD